MARLADMEEILENIIDENLKSYMREALICYMSGAYRGSIVMCFIAIHSHLVSLLKELSTRNSEAKKIYEEVIKKINGQEVYELYLADNIKSKNLIKEIDAEFLEIIRKLRNKSAHPSGHIPLPEEARYVYRETIERFLSKEVLISSAAVEEITERLKEKHYIVSKGMDESSAFISEEIGRLSMDALPMLVSKISTIILKSDDKVELTNARMFMMCLAKMDNDDLQGSIIRNFINKYSSNEKFKVTILSTVSYNAFILRKISDINNKRIASQLEEYCSEDHKKTRNNSLSHPSVIASKIIELSDDAVYNIYEKSIKKCLEQDPYHPLFAKNFAKIDKFKNHYFELISEKARSTDFTTANRCATALQQIDERLAEGLSNEQCFMIIANVNFAAECGAYEAISLKDAGFETTPYIANKANNFIDENSEKAIEIFNKGLNEGADLKGIKQTISQNKNEDGIGEEESTIET